MELSEKAILILAVLCGGVLAPALGAAVALMLGIAADARQGLAHKALPVRSGGRWRRYEHRKITG